MYGGCVLLDHKQFSSLLSPFQGPPVPFIRYHSYHIHYNIGLISTLYNIPTLLTISNGLLLLAIQLSEYILCRKYNYNTNYILTLLLIQHFTTCEIYRYLRLRPRSLRQTQTHSDFIPWFGLPLATIPQKKHCFVL